MPKSDNPAADTMRTGTIRPIHDSGAEPAGVSNSTIWSPSVRALSCTGPTLEAGEGARQAARELLSGMMQ